MANPNPKPALQNLRPFTREGGDNPAPKGRKNAGLSLIEWCNEMADWAEDEIEAIRDNPRKPLIQRRAAERLLDKEDVWNVVEHTHHRPLNKSDITHHDAEPRTESERAAARDSCLARIRGRIKRPS